MRPERGVTLVELMIAMIVSAVALTGALLMVQAQQRTFHTGNKVRQAQQNGRSALLYLEQKIALAGFGMDPAEALDFSWYRCAAGPASCPRDFTNAPDELVFYARNPSARVKSDGTGTTFYGAAWQVDSVSSTTLRLEARGGESFFQGQIIQLACSDELVFTHVTLASNQLNVPVGPVDLALAPASPASLAPNVAADPFRRQDATDQTSADFKKWNRCLVTPRAFLVDRYRFYVRPVTLPDGRVDPYLVLDQGIDSNGDGKIDQNDELLIADGIENLQVAYSFIDPTLPVAGTIPGTAIAVPNPGTAPSNAAQTITPTNFPGAYDAAKRYPLLQSTQYLTSSSFPLIAGRTTNDQGNVRAVQIALVARSPDPDPSGFANLTYTAGSPLWLLNSNQAPPWLADYLASGRDRYMRAVFTSTVAMPNLASRGLLPN